MRTVNLPPPRNDRHYPSRCPICQLNLRMRSVGETLNQIVYQGTCPSGHEITTHITHPTLALFAQPMNTFNIGLVEELKPSKLLTDGSNSRQLKKKSR